MGRAEDAREWLAGFEAGVRSRPLAADAAEAAMCGWAAAKHYVPGLLNEYLQEMGYDRMRSGVMAAVIQEPL